MSAPGLIFTSIVTIIFFNIKNCPNSTSTREIDRAMLILGDMAHNIPKIAKNGHIWPNGRFRAGTPLVSSQIG